MVAIPSSQLLLKTEFMGHLIKIVVVMLIVCSVCQTGVIAAADIKNRRQEVVLNEGSLPPVYDLLLNSCGRKKTEYSLSYGRWDPPEAIFVLPSKADGSGYYYPDIQASFTDINWQTLDRLYIPAGKYSFINIGNLPNRNPCDPLIITNYGGQVQVGGFNHYYLFVLGGGSNWVLTGRYDPISLTGDTVYKGHWGGEYFNSRDSYGILVDDSFVRPSVSGLSIGRRATDFEVEFIEIREVGFAGMVVKTDDDGTATMNNISIHDTYIHDTLSEGYYIGSTQSQPQHQIRNLELYNNRVIRSGTEAIQVGQLGGNNNIHNNVFALSAVHWKDSFQPWQDGNLQIGSRTGSLTIENNIFIGAAGNMAFASGQQINGDSYPTTSSVRFANNYFSSTRNLFFYLRNDEFPGLNYIFDSNYFTHMDFGRQEIDPDAIAPTQMIRSFTPVPVQFLSNIWNVDLDFSSQLPDGNGSSSNYSGSGNIKKAPPQLRFVNSGLADNFDYLKLEVWSAVAGRGNDQPISYEVNDIVMHLGLPYRCKMSPCPPEKVPSDNPDIWQFLAYFPDDWRLKSSVGLSNLGLMY